MKGIKKATIIIFSLILVSLVAVILKIILTEGVSNYLKHFDIGYSERLDFLLFFLIACFLLVIQRLMKLLLGKSASNFIQGISTGILGILLFCLFAGFVAGFRIAFRLNSERLIALIPFFTIGFLLPFSETWISILVNKIGKK